MMTPAEIWAKLTNQPTISNNNSAPQGANLNAPSLPGSGPQPLNPGKPPGYDAINFALIQSFLVGKNPNDVTDEVVNAIIAASERMTDKLLAKYPGFLPVTLDSKLPDNWKK